MMLGLSLLATLALAPALGVADIAPMRDATLYNSGALGVIPNQTYVSSDLVSPIFQVNRWVEGEVDTDREFIFVTAFEPGNGYATMMFNSSDLSLVYSNNTPHNRTNARIQTYKGQNYLVYWQGYFSEAAGHGQGNCLFFDNNYRLVYNISTIATTTMADAHECQMTDDGTVIITTYIPTTYDLTAVGGPVDGLLLDSSFEEINLETMTSVFTWRASHHFNVTDTFGVYDASPEGWDFFHINSIQKVGSNYLLNGRLLKVTTLVDGTTGSPIWLLGGKLNQFTDLSGGKATDFGFQHHARYWNGDLKHLTMFDNHELIQGVGCKVNCSRGLHLELDYEAMTAAVVSESWHPESLSSFAMGSYDQLDSGNAIVGWGANPSFTQHLPNGECVQDIQFSIWAQPQANYRVFANDWVGYPTWPPSIAAMNRKVYVSWNGATEVRSWMVYTGASSTQLTQYSVVAKTGFETTIDVGKAKYALVSALDGNGNVLGSTSIVSVCTGRVLE